MNTATPSTTRTCGDVDVIIPARNAAATIRDALASVLAQTVLPRAIIVVDDGSTDSTLSVVEEFGSERIRTIGQPPTGVSRARNVGIEASSAKFVAFLDADDTWDPNKLERQLKVFDIEPEVGVVYSGTVLIDDLGKEIPDSVSVPYLKGYVFEEILLYQGPIYGSASSVMTLGAIVKHAGGFDESMRFSEDVDLWVRLAKQTTFSYATDPLVRIRVHANSATRRSSEEKDRCLLLDHSRYLEKWTKDVTFPSQLVDGFGQRIINCGRQYRWGIREYSEFHDDMMRLSPQFGSIYGDTNRAFFGSLIMIAAKAFIELAKRRAMIFKRIRNFCTTGSIYLSQADRKLDSKNC